LVGALPGFTFHPLITLSTHPLVPATELCVGCGAAVPRIDGPVHRYMTSAPGCWERYGELLGVLAIRPSLTATRIMCVDAYAAQHPGTPNPQAIQSVAIHLVNMHGYLVRRRAPGPPRVVGHKGEFPWLNPPSFASARTVLDMPVGGSDEEIEAAARQWVESVWAAWSAQHAQVAGWFAKYGGA
jgi:hypothetical protein